MAAVMNTDKESSQPSESARTLDSTTNQTPISNGQRTGSNHLLGEEQRQPDFLPNQTPLTDNRRPTSNLSVGMTKDKDPRQINICLTQNQLLIYILGKSKDDQKREIIINVP